MSIPRSADKSKVLSLPTPPECVQWLLFPALDVGRGRPAAGGGGGGEPQAAPAPRPPGLSKVQSSTARFYKGGSRLVLPPDRSRELLGYGNAGRPRGGPRGVCRGMSRHAQATARRWFNSIDVTGVAATWFATMTVPADEAFDVREFKRVIERYFARLLRAWGDRLFWYWAIEPTAAGVLHLHACFFWVSSPAGLSQFRRWNDHAWASSTRCVHPSHQKTACNVERSRSWRGVRSYLAGYLSPEKWAHWDGSETGRVHGVRNRGLVPVNPEEVPLSPMAEGLLRRAVAKVRARRTRGVWRICPDGRREPLHRVGILTNPWCDGRAMVKTARRAGEVIKVSKGRVHRREVLTEWTEEFLQDGRGRLRRLGMVVTGREHRSFGPRELELVESECRRLIRWAVAEAARREEFERECLEADFPAVRRSPASAAAP